MKAKTCSGDNRRTNEDAGKKRKRRQKVAVPAENMPTEQVIVKEESFIEPQAGTTAAIGDAAAEKAAAADRDVTGWSRYQRGFTGLKFGMPARFVWQINVREKII